MTAGGDGRALLSWIEETEGGHVLRYSRWESSAWSAPRTVAQGTDWFVNWADFPSVTSLEDGSLLAHWLQKTGEDPYAYAVMLARSSDDGRSWSPPASPHDVSPTEHGFVSTVPLPMGRAAVIWLDGRETGGGHGGGGAMTLRSAILGADGGLERSDLLDPRVCDCCQTSAVPLGGGSLMVVYRDRSDTEIRDISLVTFDGTSWSAPRQLHADGWEIEGCPVNGPAIATDGDRIAVAWFTAAGPEGKPHVRVAFSDEGGESFTTPQDLDLGHTVGRVDVDLLEDGAALVTWIEGSAQGARILARRVQPGKPPGPPLSVAATTSGRSSGFPRMARAGSQTLIAWTDASSPPRVRSAVLTSDKAP